MSTGSIRKNMRQLVSDMRQLHKTDAANVAEWIKVRADGRRPEFVAAIMSQSWPRLASKARAELKAGRSRLDAMKDRQRRIQEIGQSVTWAAVLAEAAFVPTAKRQDWTSLRKQIKQRLLGDGLTATKANAALNKFEAMDGTELGKQGKRLVELLTNQLNAQAQKQFAALSGAVLALAVARFNESIAAPTDVPATAASTAAGMKSRLDQVEKKIWTELGADNVLAAGAYGAYLVHIGATALMNEVLPKAAAVSVRRHSPSGSFTQDGRLAIELGDLIRALLRAIALGRFVAWLAKWPTDNNEVQDWIAHAKKLQFPPGHAPPVSQTISTLAVDSARLDGGDLSIEGVLGPVTIVHRGRKAISSATVTDSKGKSVKIVIPYIKLDSGGMVAGSYVRISGKWQKLSKEVGGPALLIDRLNFGELGKRSWSDWVTTRLRHSFEAVPHGLAASWSWEAGADGTGNQLRYGTWFAKVGG
jgi:hypothetical protein